MASTKIQRQYIITHPSPDIMGPGSWVKMRTMKHGEQKEFSWRLDELKEKVAQATSAEERKAVAAEVAAHVATAVCDHLIEWNWVDDEGNDLPLPQNAEEINELNQTEYDFLTSRLQGGNRPN